MNKGLIYGLLAATLVIAGTNSYGKETASGISADSAELSGENDLIMDLSLADIMDIKVTTTSKTEEKLSEAPGIISVVTRDEMERFGARTLKDVLMRMPSFALSSIYMTDRSTVAIRGDQLSPAANHILLLINGRPVREAEEGGIKSEMFESFPIASIEQLEVIRGPGSVLYGSNAFSGVINIITKKATENEATITVRGGVPGEFKGMASAAYQFGDVGIIAGVHYKNAKPWDVRFQATDTVFRDFSIPDNGVGTYAEVSFKGLKYMFSYDQWENFYGMQKYIPADSTNINAVRARILGRHAYGDAQWDKLFNDFGYSHKFSDIWDITANATYTKSWLKIDSFPAPNRNSFDLTGELTCFFHPLKDLNFVVGFLGNRVKGTENSGLPSSTTLDTNQNSFSGYIQGDYRIIPEIKVIAGLQGNKAVGFDLDLNPRFGLIWSPKEIVNVKALYSTAFRAPTMQELYLKHPTLKGTPTLKPEKIKTIDLGVNFQTENISFGINGYYSEITNSIYQKQKAPPPNLYTNSDIPTTIAGMEVEGKYYITKELMLTGSGLYQKNETGDSAGNMMPVPEMIGKGGISYSTNGFTASVFNIYEGKLHKRYTTQYNPTRKAFDLLNANVKYEISRLFNLTAPVITVETDWYNLLNQEVWLPATGLAKQYSLPAIKGISGYFGVTVSF